MFFTRCLSISNQPSVITVSHGLHLPLLVSTVYVSNLLCLCYLLVLVLYCVIFKTFRLSYFSLHSGTGNCVILFAATNRNGPCLRQVEEGPNGVIVHLQEEDTLIQIDASSTHIICSGDETLRCKLRDILLHCLSKF